MALYEVLADGTLNKVAGNAVSIPIGTILAYTDDTKPALKYGGTWERLKDCFLWASGDTTSITYVKNGTTTTEQLTAGSRGGEFNHTLTVAELPIHDHILKLRTSKTSIGYDYGTSGSNVITSDASKVSRNSSLVGNTGSGQSHNNMPPYKAFNIWVRIG